MRGVDIPSLTGEYPHHLAAQNGHLEILRMLVENGADQIRVEIMV